MTPWTTARQASLSITNFQNLLKLMSTKAVMPSNDLSLCRPLFLLPAIFPSIRVFSNESVLHIWWLMYWSFSFSISPSNEYSGLISFRIDWFDLPAVQGTLESSPTPQVKSINSSALSLLYSQLSHPYMTMGKTIAFEQMDICWQSNMSLLFNMLSRFAIAFFSQGARVF